MLELALVVKRSTLAALTEHSVHELGGSVTINETEAVVLLDAEVVKRLLDLTRPGDTRIDDVIKRAAL